MSDKRLLVVDGSNLLFQMYFGMPARIINAKGDPIQGTLGFVGALLKMLRRVDPSHAVVLFDSEAPVARRELDENYKANRPAVDEEDNPFTQLPDIYAALDLLGIRHAEITGAETDDAIAAYALTYGGEWEVVIASFDSDFFQLITDRVSVLRYRGDNSVLLDPAAIFQKFGIRPSQYADFKSLTGDTADNIKGADKVGPKTAAALINQFGSLDALLNDPDRIEKPSIGESIKRNTERLRINYRLIKLQNSTPLPFPVEALAYTDNGMTTMSVLYAIGAKP